MTDATIPKHTYETTEGTEPTPYAEHQPRTVKHVVTVDHPELVSMMTEIGDGVFVAWTDCRKCQQHITRCACPQGPTEPEYMKPWRDKRFKRGLNDRPDPSYDMLDSIIEWVRERGYTVTKAKDRTPLDRPSTAFERPEDGVYNVPGLVDHDPHPIDIPIPDVVVEEAPQDDEAKLPEQVDTGLDKALESVRAMKDAARLNGIDAGF